VTKTTKPSAEQASAPAEVASIAQARVELQRGLRLFKAFEAADNALAVLEQIDQLANERTRAADKALADRQQAEAALDAAVKDIAAAKEEARRKRTEATEKAAAIVAQADDKAREMVTAAEGKVEALRKQADAQLAEMLALQQSMKDAEAKVAAAQAIIERAAKVSAALGG